MFLQSFMASFSVLRPCRTSTTVANGSGCFSHTSRVMNTNSGRWVSLRGYETSEDVQERKLNDVDFTGQWLSAILIRAPITQQQAREGFKIPICIASGTNREQIISHRIRSSYVY